MICHVSGCGGRAGWYVPEGPMILMVCEDCGKNAELQGFTVKILLTPDPPVVP